MNIEHLVCSWWHRATAAALVLMAAAAVVAAPPPSLEVGQPFPDLALPAADDGRPRSIAEFRGRKVVLHVFASW